MLIGVLDAALTVAIPVGLFIVVALLVWAIDDGARSPWTGYFAGAADVWFLGHGVDIRFTLGESTAFTVTIAALGPGLVTALGAIRGGRRLARTDAPALGWAAGVAIVAIFAAILLLIGSTPAARPVAVQAILWPTIVAAVGGAIGFFSEGRTRNRASISGFRDGVRAGVGATAIVIGVAALAFAALLAAGLTQVIGLAESLHAGAVGGLALTVAELALLPNAVVWAASWLVGPGFAIGTGTSISPLGTQLGPLPSLPFLGALPTATPTFALVGVLVPIVAGFVVGVLTARRSSSRFGGLRIAGVGLLTGVGGGGALGLLAAAASGAAGPGRFVHTGPDALLVAGVAAIEIALPAMLGLAMARTRVDTMPGPTPPQD